MNKLKSKKGITLVALVVTIAILLILAGISLNLVLGNNGIIERAQLARNKTIEDQANTTKQLKELSDELGDSLRGGIKASQIPEGYYYVGGTLTSGVVISDNAKDENKYEGEAVVGTELEGNQYVWVPCTTDSSSSKLKYARTTDWSDSIEADNGTPALKDELTLTDSSVTYIDSDTANGINANVSKEIVAQIKVEKASVEKNGGYYIGRYETGKDGSATIIKANQKPYTNIKWSDVYSLAKGIGGGTGSTTYLCSSYAWDTAINFIQNNEITNYATTRDNLNENWYDKEVRNSKGDVIKAVNFDMILATGVTTAKSNIFDMGGNVSEYTTEINPGTTESVVLRGGYDNYSLSHNFSAGYRWDVGANYALSYIGFRATLFLK